MADRDGDRGRGHDGGERGQKRGCRRDERGPKRGRSGCGPRHDEKSQGGRARDGKGRYAERVALRDVLGVFETVAGPVVTTTDVGEALDVTTESARRKLEALVERGDLRRRKTGRTIVYWLADGAHHE